MKPTLDVHDVARLLDRSADYVYRSHAALTQRDGFPSPILKVGPLTWSSAQVHAWIDRELKPEMRRRVAAIRYAEQLLEQISEADIDALATSRARIVTQQGKPVS